MTKDQPARSPLSEERYSRVLSEAMGRSSEERHKESLAITREACLHLLEALRYSPAATNLHYRFLYGDLLEREIESCEDQTRLFDLLQEVLTEIIEKNLKFLPLASDDDGDKTLVADALGKTAAAMAGLVAICDAEIFSFDLDSYEM